MTNIHYLDGQQLETIKDTYSLPERADIVRHNADNYLGGLFVFNRDNTKVWLILNPDYDKSENMYFEYINMFSTEQSLTEYLMRHEYNGDLNKFANDFGYDLGEITTLISTNEMLESYLENSARVDCVADQIIK